MKKVLTMLLSLPVMGSFLYGEEAPLSSSPQQGLIQTVVMISIAVLFFYFIIWRPEKKRRQAMDEQRRSIKKGDRVTAMGIIGIVDKVDEHTVILRMVDGGKIEFLLAAVTDVVPAGKEENGSK